MDGSSSLKDQRCNALRAVSLFTGAGGMDVGFGEAGFHVQLANEIDHDACETYRLNHDAEVIEGDLDKNRDALVSFSGVDLVFGGPPCQGFSVAGKMDPDDERSLLLRSFFEVVEDLQPKAFVCENVKALALLNKWAEVRSWVRSKTSKTYRTCTVVLDASKFGVPQKRERVFIIGLHKDVYRGDNQQLDALVQSLLKDQTKPSRTVAQVVTELGRAGTRANPRTCNAKITFAKAPVLRKSPYAGMLFNGAGRPMRANGFAPTLPASMGGNKTPIIDEAEIFEGAKSFVEKYHEKLLLGRPAASGTAPKRLRRLTVDECLQFQTFPKNYQLFGRQSSMYRQIGNAVPCDLAEAMANVVRQLLTSEIGFLEEAIQFRKPTLPRPDPLVTYASA